MWFMWGYEILASPLMFLELLLPIGKAIYRCAVSNGLTLNIAVFNVGSSHYSLSEVIIMSWPPVYDNFSLRRYIYERNE